MSRFRTLLGGLAAIGLLAAFVAIGDFSAQSVSSHVATATVKADATSAIAVAAACFNCVENDA